MNWLNRSGTGSVQSPSQVALLGSIEEEEAYVCEVIRHLAFFDLPIGVSIYPTEKTPDKLIALGVAEVKFNIEAATPELFAKHVSRA